MALGLQVPPRSGNYQLDVIKRTHVDIGSALGGNYKMALELQVPPQSKNYQLDVIIKVVSYF